MENHQSNVITTLHGTDITLVGREPAYFQIIKFSIEQSDGITAVSKALKKQTCCHFGIKDRIEVISNFFDPQQNLIGKKLFKKLFATDKQKLLVHSSNYRSVKRPEDVVKIFKLVRAELDSKLLLIGSGNGMEDIRLLVAKEKLEDDVIFLGKSRDIDPYVASADLFLLPSALESFGLAALEAMSYGVPVVATDTGGIPELVEHGKTGFLAPVGDVKKMAEYALDLLTNEEKYAAFSLASQLRTANEFSSKKIVPIYEAFYKKILNDILFFQKFLSILRLRLLL